MGARPRDRQVGGGGARQGQAGRSLGRLRPRHRDHRHLLARRPQPGAGPDRQGLRRQAVKRARLLFAVAALMVTACTPLATGEQVKSAPSYNELLARAKRGDRDLDYQALRYAYAGSPGYDPYGGSLRALKTAMGKATKILEIDYVDIDAHMLADLCFRQLGDTARAEFHRAEARGLMRSILQSGDGKSPENAFVVIAVDEEYSLIGAMGLKVQKQSLVNQDGHAYDRMDVTGADADKAGVLFFNVDRPLSWMDEQFKKKK